VQHDGGGRSNLEDCKGQDNIYTPIIAPHTSMTSAHCLQQQRDSGYIILSYISAQKMLLPTYMAVCPGRMKWAQYR